jgi:hypothetical protein
VVVGRPNHKQRRPGALAQRVDGTPAGTEAFDRTTWVRTMSIQWQITLPGTNSFLEKKKAKYYY